MNLRNKILYAFAGFVIGNIFLLTLFTGVKNFDRVFPQKAGITTERAVELIKSGKIREVNIKDDQAILRDYLNEDYQYFITSDSDRELILERIKFYNSVNPNNSITMSEAPRTSDFPPRVFQLLFILFLVSPPIIVVLLLVIIKKMNNKKSLE